MEKKYNLLVFPNKKIRAKVIKQYLVGSRYKKIICFSCGNAVNELRLLGLDVLYIGENGDFSPSKWYKQKEINNIFPEYFDATSGHLPIELMLLISEEFKKYLGDIKSDNIYVPSGSGETVLCLKLAYPKKNFIAVYNLNKATEYDKNAPLNSVVRAMCKEIIFEKDKV